MNTDCLRRLLALAETGSYSQAAALSGVTQPAVSLAVKKMEGDLGVKLFERSGNRYVPTAVGRLVLESASEMLKAEDRLMSSVRHSREASSGKLRIATSNIPGEYVLPLMLGDFKALYPGIEPLLEIMDSSKVIGLIRSGGFELGFIGSRIESEDLEATPFCPDDLVVICHPAHPLAAEPAVEPDRLAREKFLLREEGSGTRGLMIEALEAAGLDTGALQVEMELGSTGAVISAVESGAGVSLISSWAARVPVLERRVGIINVPGLEASRFFSVITRKDLDLTPQSAALRDFVLARRSLLEKHAL